MFCWANGALVMKMIDEALINEFIFNFMHGFSKWYIMSSRIAKVTVKTASEATQMHKGYNDVDEDEYAAIITCSRSSQTTGTKCASKEISKTPKAPKSARSSIQHRILCRKHSNKQVQQSCHDCVHYSATKFAKQKVASQWTGSLLLLFSQHG